MSQQIAQHIQSQWFLGDEQERQHGLPHRIPLGEGHAFNPFQRNPKQILWILLNLFDETGRIDHRRILHRIRR